MAPLNLSLNTLLFSFAIIIIVMSYYDNYVDDSVQADVYATSSTEHPFFGPATQGGGVKGGKFCIGKRLLCLAILVGVLIAIPFLKEIQIVIIITWRLKTIYGSITVLYVP